MCRQRSPAVTSLAATLCTADVAHHQRRCGWGADARPHLHANCWPVRSRRLRELLPALRTGARASPNWPPRRPGTARALRRHRCAGAAIGVIECDRPVDLAVATAALDRGVWLRPFRTWSTPAALYLHTAEITQITSAMVEVARLVGLLP